MQEERDLMQGLDHIQNVRLKLLVERDKTIFDRIAETYAQLLDAITPLKDKLKVIKSQHINSIQSVFRFLRNMISASLT